MSKKDEEIKRLTLELAYFKKKYRVLEKLHRECMKSNSFSSMQSKVKRFDFNG